MPYALGGSAGVSIPMLTYPQAKQATDVGLQGVTCGHTCPAVLIKKLSGPQGHPQCIAAKMTHWRWPCIARRLGGRCRRQLGHREHVKRQLPSLHLKDLSRQ